jgi:hypothetical protein
VIALERMLDEVGMSKAQAASSLPDVARQMGRRAG